MIIGLTTEEREQRRYSSGWCWKFVAQLEDGHWAFCQHVWRQWVPCRSDVCGIDGLWTYHEFRPEWLRSNDKLKVVQ